MPRLNKLDNLLFTVEEHPVFALVKTNGSERHLRVPDKKAIVNVTTQRVLGVVGKGYRLVTNCEALEWAYQCCQTAFPETKPGEWEVKSVDAPSTAGYCHIDLFHNSTALDFKFLPANERPQAYGPFIRVTNSYNGLRALSFNIGFYRKVCTNGMIAPQSVISFKFNHSQHDLPETIQFEIAYERLTEVKKSLGAHFDILRKCEVSGHEIQPLAYSALLLKRPEPWEPRSRLGEEWQMLTSHLSEMSDRYTAELGNNAYAVFNTITEFATHPLNNRCVHRDRHSFQTLAGIWLNTFTQASKQPDFSVAGYLEKTALARDSNGSAGRARI
jgi:hypothetical protein